MSDFDLLQQRLNLASALKERPDAFARRTKIAAALQKPPGLINADDENLYDVDSTMRALDGRPVLLKTIRDNSAFAKLAHDDFERLANIEHLATLKQERLRREREANRPWFMHGALDEAWANIRKIPKAAWADANDKEVEDLRYTLQELEKAGTLTEEGRARIEADIKIHENQRDAAFDEIADINRSIADNSPEDLNIWQKMGRGAVTSLPQMAAAAGITMASRNPTLGALAMGYGVKETSTAEARIAGLDYDAAQRKGMIDGAAEAAFEILPLGKMMGLYGRGAAQEGRATLKELGKTVASEVAGENATQLIQDANNLWHGLDPVWQKAIEEHGLFSAESLKIQGERQLIASGAAALTSGTLSAPALIANMRRSQEQDIANLTAMTDAARASKLNQRAPDVFRGLAERIGENADIQHYYVDGNALHQSGLVAALEEALPDRVGEIRQALSTGGTVQIPAADILTKIAPDKGLEDAITPHLRTADGLSLHELETTGQAELEGAITENVARAAEAETRQTEADAIRDDIAAQLTATGRMTADASTANAALPAAFYQNIAERLGISVSEAYEKYKLKVVGEPLVGLNQEALPGTYFRRNNRDEPYNDDFVMMFADKTDRIDHYGRNLWQIPPDSGVRVRADSEEFRAAMREWLEDNETWFREMGYANEPGWMDTLMDLANPDDIVDSAGFWDIADRSIMRYFDEEVMQPNGWDVVETYDGAIAFNPDIVDRVEEAEDDFDEWIEAQHEEYKAAHPQQEDTENKQERAPEPLEEIKGRALEGETVTHHVYDLDLDKTWAFTNAEDAAAFQQRKGEESGDASRFSLQPVEKPYVLRKKSAGTLNQDPVPSGDFSAQTTEQQRQFAETAQQYGGEEAYAAAKEAGETELDYQQWVQVRTPAFKAWFGDWQNDPANASKVVNPHTGEPLVVYHYTEEQFNQFELAKARQSSDIPAFFFTTDPAMGMEYGSNEMQVFLNIRNLTEKPSISPAKDGKALREELEEQGYDGTLVDDSYDDVLSIEYAAFYPNQIKSATDNSGAFDAGNDSILHQNTGTQRGAFDPSTNTIALLEKADLSTFIHELGHFYFETLTRIANDLRARDNAAGGGTLTEGEIQILKDVDTLIGKAGHTLDDWNQMTLEERRYHHETVARQFEAYLMEGKAPDVELQGIFSRARAWLFAVYKKLTALNVKLDDDVRQVFDRLLASDEAIQLAEQNRSMGALFATPEAAGMTAEQFADYQRQFQGASDAALDEMSLRMLGDAKAIARLKHRALQAKDKEAKILRHETEIEARNAIMAQPVYRVWQMLTGKMNADTTIASNKRPWTDDVAPEHDDLFTAIAKLGGINRQEIESTWGFDPADKISPVKPGFFVLRREGGQSLDGMRQALTQYGYLTESDSLNDFYELFEAQRRGDTQYSNRHIPDPGVGKTGEHAHLHDLPAFRLDYASLAEMGYGDEQIATLGRKVKKKGGIHPDLLAELVMDADGNPVYDSGDALVQALLAAPEPKTAERDLTDRIMLERHGELATPEAVNDAAELAIHNDRRLRVLATEYNALAKAAGSPRLVQSAARQLAAQAIGQKRIRDLSPAQYTRMETRAAKAALAAMKKGDIATAAAEKRNQTLQAYLARKSLDARAEIHRDIKYLRRMNKLDPKTVAIEEREQIEALLERYNLRDQSGKALDRRQSLAEWVQAQREQGIEPDIAPEMLDELKRQPWQTLTVDELRGLVDTVRQIEHRGKVKNQLLLEQKQQDLNVAKEEISETVKASGNGKIVDNSTPATWLGQRMAALRRFGWMHTKASTVFYILDGGQRNGPMWRYFGKLANARANFEAAERARLSEALMKISTPLFKRKGLYKRSIRSDIPDRNGQPRVFTPMQVFTVALNMGNAGNLQRLLDGNHWTREQVERLTANLTGDEWRAVQDIWNLFESMKEQVAAKERRVNGIEPQWVEAVPLTVTSIDGETLHLRGGYYPVKYDAGQSQQAEQFQDAEAGQIMTNAAFTSATTRRSYTKARAAAVKDRPLLLDISVMYDGLNEIVHDLAWHEFLIDANRLIRSHRVDSAIRDYHGAEYVRLIKDWLQDIAAGDKIPSTYGARMVAAIRQNVSFAGLAFNVVSALKQLSGLPNSIVRVGAPDILAATLQYMRRGRAMTREAVAASAVMENRARTRFRELNEVRNSLRRQGRVKQQLYRWGYAPLLFFQQQVDVITWHGEYHKQLAAGMSEADAVALADQAVLDAQGGGELKDLSAIERDPVGKIFTVFYSYMNTVLNLGITTVKGRASIGRKAAALLTLFAVPAIIDTLLGTMLTLGDDDDDDETLGQKLVEGQIGYLMGLTVLTREASGAAKALFGVDKGSYKGPTAFRFFDDLHKAAKQIGQGEMDEAMLTSIINLSGDFGLPSAQINRSIKGIKALEEGKTDNPLAVAVGYKEKK